MTAKPTPPDLGIDPAAQHWQRSGSDAGAIEIAFAQTGLEAGRQASPAANAEHWVLMRVADDPDSRVLVFDQNEWECFLDGARKGEFDDAASFTGR
jgi:hypothetical protein